MIIADVASLDTRTIAIGIPLAVLALGLLTAADLRRERGRSVTHLHTALIVVTLAALLVVVGVRFQGLST